MKILPPRSEVEYFQVPKNLLFMDQLTPSAVVLYLRLRANVQIDDGLYDSIINELKEHDLVEFTQTGVRAILPSQKPRKQVKRKKKTFGSWDAVKTYRIEDLLENEANLIFFMSYHAMIAYVKGYGKSIAQLYPRGNKFHAYKTAWMTPMETVFSTVCEKRYGKQHQIKDFMDDAPILRDIFIEVVTVCKQLGQAASMKNAEDGMNLPQLKSAIWLLGEVCPVSPLPTGVDARYKHTVKDGTGAILDSVTGEVYSAGTDEYFKIIQELQ